MAVQSKGLTPTQAGVQIVQNIVQLGMNGDRYVEQVAELHKLMSEFAMGELRAMGMKPELTVEIVTSEANEDEPEAEAYWRQTSVFFRKVFQAAAAAA